MLNFVKERVPALHLIPLSAAEWHFCYNSHGLAWSINTQAHPTTNIESSM